MVELMNNEQFGYFAKDLAIELEITTSSLRRWSLEFEKEGYEFERNDKNQRIYYERDFKAFRELKRLLSNSVPFKDAIKAVVSMRMNAQKAPSVYVENEDIVRLSKRELEEIIQTSVKKAIEDEREAMFRAFEVKLNNVIEQRDRYLTQELHRSLEEKKLEIAAAKEQEIEEKKPWWKSIFN